MSHELTPTQAREIFRLRQRHPGAEVTVHPKPWGVIVEARRGTRSVEIARFDWDGGSAADAPLLRAA